jgi:hypothetical protein
MVVIIWSLDLQLHVQSVPITTINVVRSNLLNGEVYSIQHYVINLSVTCNRSVVFSGFPNNKTDCHDITEILLKVALNIITLTTRLTPLTYWIQVLIHTSSVKVSRYLLYKIINNLWCFCFHYFQDQ